MLSKVAAMPSVCEAQPCRTVSRPLSILIRGLKLSVAVVVGFILVAAFLLIGLSMPFLIDKQPFFAFALYLLAVAIMYFGEKLISMLVNCKP